MSKRRHDLDEYLDVEKRSRQDLSYLFHIPPTPPDAPQEQCPGLKMDLYPHQKRSLKRMMDLEDSPKLDGLGTFRDLTTMGGVVADTVGMGKTAEVIALCVRRGGVSTSKPRDGAINVKANFVVCPSHLCGSWKTEVDKFTDLAAVVANGATSQKVVTEVDFVILPLEALVAPDSKQIYFWRSFVFRRCVFDECHDAVFLDGAAMAIFQSLQSDNVWAVSGTPFPHHDSSILAINQLLRIRLRINLTQTPFAFTTKRKLPQSDVFTRLKELIYIRNTPETASAELVAAVPSPFPIAEGQGERSAPSTLGPGYTEDVFYIDLCDVERALYRDEAWRSGYMAPSGDESADPWHSRFTKLRMFCSAPLVGSLAAEAELEGEEVELAPLVDGSHQRGKQESLFRLTLEQLRVHVVRERGREIQRAETTRKNLLEEIPCAQNTLALFQYIHKMRALGPGLDPGDQLALAKGFRIMVRDQTGARFVSEIFSSFERAKSWALGLPQEDLDHVTRQTEKFVRDSEADVDRLGREAVELSKQRDYFDGIAGKVQAMQATQRTGEASSSQGVAEASSSPPSSQGVAVEAPSEPQAPASSTVQPTQSSLASEVIEIPSSDGPAADDEKENRPAASSSGPTDLAKSDEGSTKPAGGLPGLEDDLEICLICSEDLREVAVGPCGHFCCPRCLDQWITLKGTCPTCRKETGKGQVATFTIRETERHLPRLVAKHGTKPAALIRVIQAHMADPDDPDPRFIVFSQYDRMLHVLAASLKAEGIESATLRGPRHKKDAALLRFRTSPTCRVLMMSLSGATAAGLNLQNANHVVIVEAVAGVNPSHAAAVETQAIGRTVRLGQRRRVKVTRFVCRNTIEERLYEMTKEAAPVRELVGGKREGGKVEVIEIPDDD